MCKEKSVGTSLDWSDQSKLEGRWSQDELMGSTSIEL
jgi:hypothetical protein